MPRKANGKTGQSRVSTSFSIQIRTEELLTKIVELSDTETASSVVDRAIQEYCARKLFSFPHLRKPLYQVVSEDICD